MSANAVSAPVVASTSTTQAHPGNTGAPRALSIRRWFLIASPVLAGIFAVVGAAADPAAGLSGSELYRLYADNPDDLQFKSLGFHWSYSFWIAPALLIAGYVRGKGAWLANIAAGLGFVGMTTLPGLLFIDFYDSAIGQLYGSEASAAVSEHIGETMWAAQALALPGVVGFMLGLPLAAVALWRAGLVRWWAPLAVIAGYVAFTVSSVTWWGAVLTTVFFTVFAYGFARGTAPDRV